MLACGAQGLRFDCLLCKTVDDDLITFDHHPGTATSCKSQLMFPFHLYFCKMEIKPYLRSTSHNYVKFLKLLKL